ncbi:LOW QUALITY PROTEIN: OTU domain-containing protein 3 [Gastrophryne carolinensis]
MSRKQTVRSRPGKKAEIERKRDERASKRAFAKERKNRGGEAEEDAREFLSFANQLQALGLRLREVPGDGNCLFRALGDQLEGHSRHHLKHQETAHYMVQHRHDFEPFVEDDVPFDRHALQIRGSEQVGARELHIAYRYGEHYDSVRRINDNTEAPANLQTEVTPPPLTNAPPPGGYGEDKRIDQIASHGFANVGAAIRPVCASSLLAVAARKTLSKNDANDRRTGKPRPAAAGERQGGAVQRVQSATGCEDVQLILQSLEAESYNIQSTIQVILQIEELRHVADEASEQHAPAHTPASRDAEEREQPQRRSGAGKPEEGSAPDNRGAQDENKDNRNPKVSNKARKEQQRLEKKRRQEARHRQRLQEQRAGDADNNRPPNADPDDVTVVKAFAALSI